MAAPNSVPTASPPITPAATWPLSARLAVGCSARAAVSAAAAMNTFAILVMLSPSTDLQLKLGENFVQTEARLRSVIYNNKQIWVSFGERICKG
jgi:hypothetical protein